MAKVTARRVVPGSQERVWHLLSDLDRLPEWLPNLERIEHTSGPARGLNREQSAYLADGTEMRQKIVAWDNSRRVAWRIDEERRGGRQVGGDHSSRTDVDLRPSGADTEMTLTRAWRPSNPITWVQSLVQMHGKRIGLSGSIRAEQEAALENLAALLKAPDSDEAD